MSRASFIGHVRPSLLPLLVVIGGLVVMGGCVSAVPKALREEGLLASASDSTWRAEVWANGASPVLRVWGTGMVAPLLENTAFLPPDLGRTQPQWHVQSMVVQRGRLVLSLRYQPQPSVDSYQDKRFEFDLNTQRQPLVNYRVATVRGDKVDWQKVDFVQRTAQSCRNAPSIHPDDCKPTPAVLTEELAPALGSIGNAEDYVPPIKLETRY